MTKNIAHRGFSGKYPENTMLAFKKAIEAGADGIELDVHFTKDKELVIIHDETIDRTTDGTGEVESFTYEELSKFNAYGRFEGQFDFQKIPTLREYFELVKPVEGFITNIELKTGINEYPGIEEAVLKLIDEFSLRDRIIISSFNHFSVMRFKAIAPDMQCGFLEESRIIDFGAYAKKYNVEFVHPLYKCLTEDVFEEIYSNGIGINTWTVNDEESVRFLVKNNVNAVIGNFPDMTDKVLKELK
ncbi:MAG: glycerophosphodiester phosphodiesterase [Clostridia bacterium]|nr:glycerophosphodiester phosphodiesterase [Clostridia bacterium]